MVTPQAASIITVRRAVLAGVIPGHHRRLQLIHLRPGQTQADNAAAIPDKPRHLRGTQKKPSAAWRVYIIETQKGLLYTGCTTDVERRFGEHQAGGIKAAKFLKVKGPLTLRYQEQVANKRAALKRENEIKKMSRDRKLKLIQKR